MNIEFHIGRKNFVKTKLKIRYCMKISFMLELHSDKGV